MELFKIKNVQGSVILYRKSNLVYAIFLHKFYFLEKLKIVNKNLHKLNCSYGKVSHTLNPLTIHYVT